MSYQKSVALLSCCLLFSMTFVNLALASVTGTPSGFDSGDPEAKESIAVSALFTSLPPDTEGPTLTITPPNDVNLTGCYSDYTYSEAAMGKPSFVAYDECGTATVTETRNDTYIYCAEADDATPEGGLTILREFTFVAEDCYGNTTTESITQTITVTDNVAPSFVESLPADVTVDCGSIPAAATLTATDDCDSEANVSYTETSSTTCAGLVRTWVASDDCGNTTTHTQTITVTDTDDPVIAGTPSNITQTADAGDCGAVVTWTAPTATDNCTLDTFTSTHDSGDFFAVGTTTVSFTATDDCGNSTTTSFTVTITDDEAPAIAGMPADITQTADAGDCSAVVNWTAPTTTDNCSTTMTSTHDSGDSFAVGTTTVTYTSTDVNGNITTASFTVTVTDDENPAIAGNPGNLTQTAGAGQCSAVVSWTALTASDNCAISTFTSTHNSNDAFAVGTTTVTYTAMDIHGNSSTSTFNVTVTDDEDPTISSMPANITQTADAGVCNAVVTWADPTTDDNCAVSTFTSSHNSGDTFNVGSTTVTYTSMDVNGNSSSASFTITVTDDEAPVISGTPANISQDTDADACVATVTWTEPTDSDNCSSTLTSSHSPGDTFAPGTTTVTYTSTDAASNVTTSSFTITVTDNEDPTISGTPANITVSNDAGLCSADVTWAALTADDNCSVTSFTSTHDSGDTFAVGTTTVTYTAEDAAGNSTTSSFTVTVTDDEDPAITAASDQTVECDGSGNTTDLTSWLASNGGATATDNCTNLTWSNDYAGDCTVAVGDFTTYQQGGWGLTSGGVHDLLDANFATVFPAGVTVGCGAGYEIVFTSPEAIETYLPCTGDAEDLVLSHSGPNPTASSDPSCWNNALVSQILTAKLNAQFDATLAGFSASDLLLGDLVATSGDFVGMTANEIIAIADDVVGACSNTYTPNQVRAALNDFNRNFAGGNVDEGLFAPAGCFYGQCAATGSVMVTFTATDDAGNTSSTSATFTIEDTTDPTISAQDFTLTLDANGEATLTTGDVDLGTSDACGTVTLSLSQTNFDCVHLGTNTVTFTAEDECGNTSTQSLTITVQDTEDPTIDAMADINLNVDAGLCTAVATWTDPSTSDNCGIQGIAYSTASGSAFPLGATTVTATATDDAGNTATTSFTVTVTDNLNPVISNMPTNISQSNDAGVCAGAVTWPMPSATDNCSVSSFTSTHSPGDQFAVGTTTVTYTAIDGSNNTTTASFNVTISDDEDPTISGMPANITQTAAAGECDAVVTWADPTTDDNCAVSTFTSTHNPGDTFAVGTTTVTYTSTDIHSNVTTASFTVTVTDDEDPAIAGMPSDITQNADAGQCGAVVDWAYFDINCDCDVTPSATDNCGIASFTSSHNEGDTFPVGTTTVTYTATDIHSNVTTASFTITVVDNQAPTISDMPGDLSANNDAGACNAAVTWDAPSSADNCGVTSFTSSHSPGSAFAVGTTTVTYTAQDAAGNTMTASFTVTVTDNENPVIAGNPGNLSATNDAGICGAAVTWTAPTATDNCSQTLTSTHNPGDTFAVGTTTVTYTSTDPANNTATISFNVVVTDTEDPVIPAISDMTVSTDAGTCDAVVTFSDPAATDNCAISTLTPDIASGSTFSLGTTTVTYTATDIHGNSSTASFDVIVEDNEGPTFGTPAADETVECDGSGNTAALMAWLNNNGGAAATDNCSGVTWSNDFTTMANTCGGAGAVQVIFTATDAAGNTSSTTATFTIEDTTAPTITTPASDLTVECDGAGNTSDLNTWLGNFAGAAATDGCSSATLSHNYGTGASMSDLCGATGSVTVTFTATDVCGNTSTTNATFTIEDTTNPTAIAQAHTVTLDAAGNGSMAASAMDNGSSDGCGNVSFSASQTSFTCADLGDNTITLTVSDECSNTATATATVTVVDNTAPTITATATDATYECDGTDYSTQFADWLSSNGGATATDACGGLVWTNNSTGLVPGCGDSESEQVTFTVTDGSGNSSTTTATFSVSDTTPPSIASDATDVTTECDGLGNTEELNAWLVANGGAGAATDLCGNVTWSNNFHDFALTCAGTGAIDVIFTATDDCGNTASTTATFTIEDTTAPTLTAGATDETVECDGAGNTTALNAWLTNNGGATADELCGTITWSNDFVALSDECGATGSATVIFTASDDCGNTVTSSATFTIQDTTDPSIDTAAADETVECDGAGNAAAFAAWLSNNGGAVASDACGGVTWSNNSAGLSDLCGATGAETVTFTATDDCGNTSSTTATFTIEDKTDPSIDTPAADETVECDGAGNAAAFAAWLSNNGGAVASDACGGVTWSHNSTGLSDLCGATGAETVIFTATDDCGNTSSTTATFTIEDTTDPVIATQAANETVECDGAGNTAAFNAWLSNNGGATAGTEVCGTATWSHNSTGLSDLCGATGAETVTFTLTDECGNTASTTATFTIEDTTDPVIASAATDLTVDCDGAGNITDLNNWLTSNGGAGAATDDCGSVTWSHDFTALSDLCGATGAATVIFTATDECGNATSTTATFTIKDDTAPAITAPAADLTVECDGSGNTTDLNTWLGNNGGATATEACGTITWTNDFSALSDLCGATGAATVTFTATDECGNASTSTATFTIEDTTSPTALGNDITVILDGNGQATITAADIDAGSSDGCGDITMSLDITSFDCDDVGPNDVVLTVTDECMNAASSTVTVIVTAVDDAAPTILNTPDDITQTNDAGVCGAVVTFTLPGTQDNCAGGTLTSTHDSGDLFPVGTTTVTFTATDASGNSSTDSFTITVTDDEAPSFSGPAPASAENYALGPISDSDNSTIQEGWTGGAQAYFQNDATDDETVTDAEANSGSNSWFYTDAYNNPGQGSPHAPSLGLPSGTGPGTTFTLEFYFKAEATADGDGSVHKIYQGTYAGDDRTGFNINIKNAADASGEGGLHIFTYSYDAGSFPITTIASNLDRNVWHKVNVTYTIDASGDPNLDTAEYSVDDGASVSANTWMNTWRVDQGFTQAYGDNIAWAGSGNSSGFYYDDITYSSDFDGSSKTIGFETAQSGPAFADITLSNDAGNCSAIATWSEPTTTDNCAVASVTSTHDSGDTFAVGTTTVTYTATDIYGNVSTSSFNVTVTDDEAPAIAGTPADITQTNDAGDCSAAVTWTEPTTSDNCAVATFTSSHNPGDTFGVGTTTVTYTSTDIHGNVSTASFDITVTDDENPTLANVPANITQTADAGQCGAAVDWEFDALTDSNVAVSAADNCGVTSFTSTHNNGDTFPVGTTTVTFTAQDAAGNTTTASFTITVTDDEAPAIAGTPADITQTNDAGNCSAAVTWTEPTSTDNCAVTSFTSTHSPGATFAVGTTTVTYTAMDAAGNTTTSSFTVTVTDDENPAISGTPADITQANDLGNCSAAVTWTEPTAADNCAIASFTSTHSPGDTFAVGTTTVTYTATDIHSNVSTSSFDITVEDTENPIITTAASDLTVECDGAGNTTELNNWLANHGGSTSSDNCAVTSITNDYDAANMSDLCGLTGAITVIFTHTDAAGNSATSSAVFTIEDTTPPTFSPTGGSETVECDGAGNLAEIDAWLDIWNAGITVMDNCGGVQVVKTTTLLTDDCAATGQASVSFTATDDCGNATDTTFTFTIEDTTGPTFLTTASDLTVECDGAGNTAALQNWLDTHGGATAEDVCGDFTWSNNFTAVSDDCGATGSATVEFYATDECGNVSTTTATFTIEDTTDPVIASPASDMTVECDGAGNTAALNDWLAANGGAGVATDDCSGVTWSNDFTGLSDLCGATGAATVIFTASDDCGNTASTTATFTIEDTTNPSLDVASADMTVECDGSGNTAQLNAWLADNGGADASDQCSGVTWSNDFTALSDLCGATGAATVTFTATDDCGLTVSTTATFTIEDTTNPSMDVESADMTVECDGSGNTAQLNAWLADNGGAEASDQCSGVTWSNDFTALSDLCGATGAATVTFTATDDCGLSTSTTATFTIEDTTPPSMDVESADMTVECDGSGNTAQLNAWLADNGGAEASDMCSGVTWSNDFTALSDLCAATGSATVTFTATDDCGLFTTTTATFTIEDTTAPTLLTTADDLTVECDGAGNLADLNGWLDSQAGATASDVCGDYVWSHDFTALSDDCGATGSATVTFTVTDECGNASYTSATFTIEDTTAPSMDVASADMTVECDGAGNTAELNAWLADNGGAEASDVCGGVTWSNDFSALSDDCGATGSTTVTFTATDDCGNTTSTTSTFTIEDTTDPVIASAAVDMTVECDGAGNEAELNGWLASNGGAGAASDDCSGVTWSNDFTALSDDCGATGSATVTFTATDDCGNATSTTATFTIEDTTNPSMDVEAADMTVECDGAGNPTELNAWLSSNGGASASDQCSGVTWSNDFTALSDLCGATGAATVTFTATDDCGLSTSTTATFTIEDTTAPVLTGDEVVIIDCSAWPWDALYQPTIDELLTVVDTAGNPIITLDEACGYTNFPIDFGVMSGGCFYDHQLIYHPVDDCGNEGDSLYQVIQVDDLTDPVFTYVPADTTFACTDNVAAYLEMATAVDACDPSVNMTFEDEIIPTACPEVFTIRRTFYAEDCGYNIATAIQNITVADTIAPALSLTAPADMAVDGCLSSADLSEAAMGSVTWTTSDDCGDVLVTYTTSDANAFSCTGDDAADEGSYVVTRTFTVTATDCAGNTTVESIDQTITITDDTAPTVSLDAPADATVYLDASCYAAPVDVPVSGDASGFLVTASDNCDSDVAHSITFSDDTTYTGVVDGVGSYDILRTYTVTVTDDCGNEASAMTSHTISVLDEIAPDVTGNFPADIVIYADDDNGYFDPTPLGAGAASADYSDNCSGEGDQTYGVAGQVPTGGLIITAIGDPNDAASTCRFVEIHNSGDGDIDLTGYALQRWTNGNAGPSTSSNIDLSSIGTMAPGQYAWIANNAGFEGCYGFAATITAGSGGPADSNGDDQIAIIDGASNIIDMFGVAGEDGSNTCHEFEDGIALRAGSNTDPNGGAWDESGWIVYSDGSSASGCTNHNANQPQNASDIALLINNWAGAGPAAPETDFNSVDISYADVTTSYTASACYTFERTWTITVTDNNGNATTVTDVQTIQVADTSAPDITALENTVASCDLFGFDLSAGDESILLAGTSFEEGSTGDQYVDTGDASVDHALANNPGQSDVNFTSTGGEMGFSSYYYSTGSNGLTDGDFVGVTSFTGAVGAFTDGSQGFQMQDTDGIMEVVFDNVDVSMGGVTLTLDYFPQSTGWETGDRIRIWVVADGGEIDLVDTDYQDIDGLGIEGQWNLATLDLDGFDDAELHISLESNSGSEGLFIDNIAFSAGNSPLAVLEANGYVSFSDNVELASTEAAITLDGTPCEGAYDIVYTATDSCGNVTTAMQRIVLEDTEAPTLTVETPEAVTLSADADCFADYVDGVPYPTASATDNCDDDVEITAFHFDGTKQYACLPSTGAFTVLRTYEFTATDNCGNTTTTQVTRLVTVVDDTAPTFTAAAPADKTVNIDPFCGANTSTTIAGMPTVTDAEDNCDSSVDIEIEHTDSAPVYTCDGSDGAAEGSYTFVRTFTITGTDDCGNETVQTVTQNITALDVTAPTITALPPMGTADYTLDADCFANLTPTATPMAMAMDACDSDVAITSTYADSAPTYTCDGGDGEAEGSFTFTRTWTVTATDDCGNSTSQVTSQTVVVSDDTDPSLSATWPADYTTDLDADCNADLTPAAAGAATASGEDGCDSDVTIEISSEDGAITYMAVNVDDVAEGGYFFTRTWTATATDDCGNSTTETHDQLITANDVTAPTQVLETLPTYSVEGCYGEVNLDPSVTGTPTVSAEDGCDSDVDIDLTYSTDDLVFNEVVGDYSLVIDTISGPEDGVLGMTTVRLYIETENEDDFISAVAGDEINPTGIRTTTSFYQNIFGGATANTYNDGLTLADPLVAFDSWVTIGIDEQPDGLAGEGETTVVGDWPTAFEMGGDVLINDFFGGSWFTTNPNTAAVAGPDHRVLLGQFTTDGQMSGQMFVQVFPNGLGSEEMRISFTFGDCAEDDDTPEGSYAFTRRWESVVTDDADNASTAVTYQHIQVLDTEAPQLTNTCGLNNGETVAYDCPGIGVLDFDPVPLPCIVSAIDNCDSEVNVTLFTETEGYIPTDDIRNYCAPVTPEAQSGAQTCDDRAPEVIRLFNFPGADDSFVMADAENLVQVMADGSMHIELEVENADGTGGFTFTADYGAGQDWATWSAGGSNYKKDCAEIYPGENIWEDWVYFMMTSGTLEGTGMYSGSSFTLSHQPANGYYGMQMGLGANNKNANYGGSAWFFWQGDLVVDGVDMGPMASSGDVYMDLDCCLEWSVDYYYTAIDDCGNPTGFTYSEAMGAGLEDGDATAAGGHTDGPVDITSVGGIKEPIRITGLAPNPTNDMSQLSFVVSENMRLRVDLYTMSGNLVQELYEGNAVTGVQYVMDIDADALSDGMYQVRISSNSYLAVKKLLVAN